MGKGAEWFSLDRVSLNALFSVAPSSVEVTGSPRGTLRNSGSERLRDGMRWVLRVPLRVATGSMH